MFTHFLVLTVYVVENIEKMYSTKSLKTEYLTWQIFFKKSRSFLIVISEFHRILVNLSSIFLWVYNSNQKKSCMNLLLSKLTSNWTNFYALFNEHCWSWCPMWVKRTRCSSPEGNWCVRISYKKKVCGWYLISFEGFYKILAAGCLGDWLAWDFVEKLVNLSSVGITI